MRSSWTRNRNQGPCIYRSTLNHWTPRDKSSIQGGNCDFSSGEKEDQVYSVVVMESHTWRRKLEYVNMAQELRHAAFCLKCILQVEQRPQKPVAEAPTNSAVAALALTQGYRIQWTIENKQWCWRTLMWLSQEPHCSLQPFHWTTTKNKTKEFVDLECKKQILF